MEINGKKVLTLPMQVLQNQKDINELKMSTPYQRHKFSVKLSNSNDEFVIFDYYTTDNEVTTDTITLDFVKTYLTTNSVFCRGLVDTATPRIAFEVTYNETSFDVEGVDIDLTDSGTTSITFTSVTVKKIY